MQWLRETNVTGNADGLYSLSLRENLASMVDTTVRVTGPNILMIRPSCTNTVYAVLGLLAK